MLERRWVLQLVACAMVSAATAQTLQWTAIPYPENDAQVRSAWARACGCACHSARPGTHGVRGRLWVAGMAAVPWAK
jgi:hypothetical protein